MAKAGKEYDAFGHAVEQSNRWLKEIMEKMGWEDRHMAYTALRSVLHTLRDRLPAGEAQDFGSELPMLIRGLFYEGWKPEDKPEKLNRGEFVSRVSDAFPARFPERSEDVIRTVFSVLDSHVSKGEMDDVKQQLPKEFSDLWPS